ncbi:MAG: U32 family peptidase, partial [Planctomycetota bacterium]
MELPELLAPVNDPAGIIPALASGADAVYLGLKDFNARRKAKNFSPDELAAAVRDCHRAGCRVYLTFNTLLYDHEWSCAAQALGAAWEAGVDALIVQDLGLIERVRAWFPNLPLHASTQMTVHHPSQLRALSDAGMERVIVARELTLDEAAAMTGAAKRLGMGVEVFIHGALCVSYSGQCLISAFLEQRSGNRGLCAQICRRPFQVCHSKNRGRKTLALSMKDISALRLLPDLVRIGVSSLKVEGRLKRPEYVAGVTGIYREALDRIAVGERLSFDDLESRLSQVFNRGFTQGGLGQAFSADHTTGAWGGPRFTEVGEVVDRDLARACLLVRIEIEPDPGDGVALFADPGGVPFTALVTKVFPAQESGTWIGIKPLEQPMRECPDRGRLYLSSKGKALNRIREQIDAYQLPRLRVRMEVSGTRDASLKVKATTQTGLLQEGESQCRLQSAEQQPITEPFLREYLGRLGGTPYELGSLEWSGSPDLFLPVRELNSLRRRLV